MYVIRRCTGKTSLARPAPCSKPGAARCSAPAAAAGCRWMPCALNGPRSAPATCCCPRRRRRTERCWRQWTPRPGRSSTMSPACTPRPCSCARRPASSRPFREAGSSWSATLIISSCSTSGSARRRGTGSCTPTRIRSWSWSTNMTRWRAILATMILRCCCPAARRRWRTPRNASPPACASSARTWALRPPSAFSPSRTAPFPSAPCMTVRWRRCAPSKTTT